MHQHQRLHRGVVERAPIPAFTTINGVVESVAYVTVQPTFTGVLGAPSGPSNNGPGPAQGPPQTSPAARPSPSNNGPPSVQSQSTRSTSQSSSSAVSSFLTTTTSAAVSALYSSSPVSSPSNNAIAGPSSTDTSSASSSSSLSSSSSSSDGMSIGGKIGMAVGIILVIAILAGIGLFVLTRKRMKKEQEELAQQEKRTPIGQPIAMNPARSSSPDAPRLSLRPVSSLVPEFIGNTKPKNRLSQGNMLTPISEAANARARNLPAGYGPGQGPMDRPRNGDNPFRDPENPFADPEKAMHAPVREQSTPVSPVSTMTSATGGFISMPEPVKDHRSSEPSAESFPIPVTQPHIASQSNSVHPPRPGQGAPPGAVPGTTYAELPGAPAPAVARGPGPDTPQANVYRILMDFRPTMEDELELRTGQLVRMLHEYDDGWALCIRLDRSQQGVVPRTCLAAKPSKPRPGPSPTGANSRPTTPQGRPRGPPVGPSGPQRPGFGGPGPARDPSPVSMPPNTGEFNQTPRPLSPGPRPQPPVQKRSLSPGPYGAGGPPAMAPAQQKRRSNSLGAQNVPNKPSSPPGPSKLGPGSSPVLSNSPGLAI